MHLDKNIYLAGFKDDDCRFLQQQLFEKLQGLSRDDIGYDFYCKKKPANRPVANYTLFPGFQVVLKHKFSFKEATINIHHIPVKKISRATLEMFKNPARLVFCFDSDCIKEGFDAAESVSDDDLIEKSAMNDLLCRAGSIRCYCLLYIERLELTDYAKQVLDLSAINGRLFNGRGLARLINAYDKELMMYEQFMKLPTLVVDKNSPLLNILTC